MWVYFVFIGIAQTTLFYDGFESGNTNIWQDGNNADQLLLEPDSTENNVLKVRGGYFGTNSTIKWVSAKLHHAIEDGDAELIQLSFNYRSPNTNANEKIEIHGVNYSAVTTYFTNAAVYVKIGTQGTATVPFPHDHVNGNFVEVLFDPTTGNVKLLADGNTIIDEVLSESPNFNFPITKMGFSMYRADEYFTLDNVELGACMKEDINLYQPFNDYLCHWYVHSASDGMATIIPNPDGPNAVLELKSNNGHLRYYKSYPASDAAITKIEFDFQTDMLVDDKEIVFFKGTHGGKFIFVHLQLDGSLRIRDLNEAVEMTTSGGTISLNTWHRIELHVNNLSHELTLWVDDVNQGSLAFGGPILLGNGNINLYTFDTQTTLWDNLRIYDEVETCQEPMFPHKNAQQRPSLLFTEADYPYFRSKSIFVNPDYTGGSVFSYIRNYANLRWDEATTSGRMGFNVVKIIEDFEDVNMRQANIDHMLQVIDSWNGYICYFATAGWSSYVPVGEALLVNIIGLDIIHNYLTDEQLKSAQTSLYRAVQWYEKGIYPHGTDIGRHELIAAMNFVFHAYLDKNSSQTQYWALKYKQALYNWMLEDGSLGLSSGYGIARLAGGRMGKMGAMFVASHLGIHDYYNDEKILACYEMMNSFTRSPNGDMTKFGNTLPGNATSSSGGNANLLIPFHYSNTMLGEQITKNYMWSYPWEYGLAGAGPAETYASPANALQYIIRSETLVKGEMPTSLLKDDSGAALWDNTFNSREAAQGIVYSLHQPDTSTVDRTQHQHPDANSLCLSAYGQQMVVNSGSSGNTLSGESFSIAKWQNSVLLDDQEQHADQDGGGLSDGLIGHLMEFGTTLSGDAK